MMELKDNFLENPTNQEIFSILEVDYTTAENWSELLEIYNKFLEVNEDEDLATKYSLKKVLIYDEMLDQPEEALEELKKVIENEEFNLLHLKYFETLSIVTSKILPLIEVYKIVTDKVDEENQLLFNYKIATLYIRRDDYLHAIEFIDKTLEIDIDYGESLDLLDYIINKNDKNIDVLKASLPIIDKTENWENLLYVYNLILAQKEHLNKEQQLDILDKKIELFENMLTGEEEKLFVTLLRAYQLEQKDEYFEKIEYYAQMLDRYQDFVKLMISLYETAEQKPFYSYKIGTIAYSILNEEELALKYLLEYTDIVEEYYEEAFSFLIEILNNRDDYQGLVDAYLKQVKHVDDVDTKVELYKQAAGIYEDQLFKLDETVKLYHEIIDVEPDNIEHYFQVERLYEELKNWPALIDIINKLVEHVDDVESYDKKKALIYDEKLVDYNKAIDEYNAILEKYSYDGNTDVVERLRELYKLENRFEDLKNFLETYKDFAISEDEVIDIEFEIADIYCNKFDDYETAFEKLKAVLDIAPDHEETIKKLLVFIKDGHLAEEIYNFLDNLLDAENNIEYWIKLNQIKIKNSTEKEEQSQLCIKVGEIYIEREGDPEKAFPYFAKGFQLAPLEDTYYKFKEYYETISAEEKALPVLENVVLTIEDEDLALLVNLDIGKLLFNDMELRDESGKYLEKVIAKEPMQAEAIIMLDELYGDADNQKELYRILLLKLEIEDDKVETLYRLRDISLDYFQDKEKALRFLLQLHEVDEYSKHEHRDMVIAFMTELRTFEKLAEFYEMVLQEEELPEYIEALADVSFTELKNFERSCELYEQILDITDDKRKVLTHLETIYEANGNQDRLTEILEEMLDFVKEANDKMAAIETIFKLGKLYIEHSAQYEKGAKMFYYLLKAKYEPETVIAYLEKFLDNNEVLFFVSDTLKGYYAYQEEWNRLIGLYKRELEFKDEDERVEVLEKIAEVYQDNLDNTLEAIVYYNELFKLTVNYEYLIRIEGLLEEKENFTKLAELYHDYIETINFDSLETKEELYLKLVNIYREEIKDADKAIACLLQSFEEYPSVNSADLLIELYKEAGENEKVKEFYYKKLEILEDVEEQTELKIELSRFLIEKFHAFQEGVQLLIEILEWENSNMRVVNMILKLNSYLKLEHLELKLRILEVLKPILTDNMEYESVSDLFASLVELEGIEHEKKLELMEEEVNFLFDVAEYEDGFDAYEELVFESKGDEGILNKSVDYAELANDFDRVISIYKNFLSKIKSMDFSADDMKSKALDFYYRLGDVTFKYLGDFEQAEKYFTAILEKDPNHLNSLYKLEELYQEQAEYENLRDLYLKLLTFSIDDEKKVSIYKKLATLLDESLYEEEEAMTYYEKVIELDATDEDVLNKLFNFYKKEKKIQDILKVVDAQCALHPEEVFYLNRSSYYYLKNFKKADDKALLDKSIALAEQSYSIEGDNEKTELILIEAYKDADDHEKIVSIYTKKLETLEDLDRKVDINIELAIIYASKMNAIDKAEACVNFVHEVDPYDTRTLDVKEQILEVQEKWDALLDLLEEKMNLVEGQKLNEVIFKKITLLTEKFQQYDEAEEYLRELVERNPEEAEYLFYGEQIFTKKDNMKGYFDFIKKQLPETESLELKSNIMSKMGDIAYDTFKKEDLAVKCYNKALEFNAEALAPIDGLKKIALDKGDYDMYSSLLKEMLEKATGEEFNTIKEELIDIYINKLQKPELVIPFKEDEYNETESDELMIALIELYAVSQERYNFDDYYAIFFDKIKTDKSIPERHIHMFNLGKASRNFGDLDSAKECFELVNKLKMGFIPNQMELGKLLLEMDDMKGALKIFQLLQLNQSKIDDIEVKKELFLNLGRLRADANDNLRAKSMFKKLLELDPDNQEAKAYLGK